MRPRLITFDCAQTLVDVTWSVDGFLHACAEEVGLTLPRELFVPYRDLYVARLPEYWSVNQSRDPVKQAAFWRQLGEDWILDVGESTAWLPKIEAAAEQLGFGPESILFRLYEDTRPALDRLRQEGVRMAVVSNWDYSLHRVMGMFGLENYFDLVLASLEEGVEKPDPRLFHICLERLGVAPEDVVHVGDNPVDDGEGAVAAGIRPVIVARDRSPLPGEIGRLTQLPEVLGWSA